MTYKQIDHIVIAAGCAIIILLLILSRKQYKKFKRLEGGGRIPEIMRAERLSVLFSVLAVVFAIITLLYQIKWIG